MVAKEFLKSALLPPLDFFESGWAILDAFELFFRVSHGFPHF